MFGSLPIALLLLLQAFSADAKSVVYETAPSRLPNGWKYLGQADNTAKLSLSIALKQPGLQELRARLDDISNPSHEAYGAHLSRDEVRQYREVSGSAVDTVVSWLQRNNVTDFALEDAWVNLNATVAHINTLLSCNMSSYRVSGSSNTQYRAKAYSLPEELIDSVDYVYPVTQFMVNKRSKKSFNSFPIVKRSDPESLMPRAAMPSSCITNDAIVPQCVVDLYNITYTPPDNLSNSSLAIAGFLEEYPGLNYIHEYLADYSSRRNDTNFDPDYNFTVVPVNGGSSENQGTGGEANLDLVCTMPYVQPLDVTYYSTGGRGPHINDDGVTVTDNSTSINEPWVPFLEFLVSQESVPQVLSFSYTDDEQTIPLTYANRVCDLFMQLTSRGVSVLVASGDGGEGGTGTSDLGCYANDGFSNKTQFIPTFPADCPYVTSVGATAAYSTVAGADFSAGGFSNYFARPAWQEAAASAYITALNGSHAGWYNTSGRGIPDISAIGSRIQIGGGLTTKGTSASAPIVASMITLINDKRLRAGKPTLGFLNPLLYSGKLDEALLDSTEGSGGSCTFNDGSYELGFDVLPGWDPVTGLGTINLGKMIDLAS
ncbi:hypothetical protein N0V82_004226 [Gnomoniopsis sp. IMI 355080]|nr:hypothetical protein N0V82_004226 [Gnomoniopsis sp. IMI 355080]